MKLNGINLTKKKLIVQNHLKNSANGKYLTLIKK